MLARQRSSTDISCPTDSGQAWGDLWQHTEWPQLWAGFGKEQSGPLRHHSPWTHPISVCLHVKPAAITILLLKHATAHARYAPLDLADRAEPSSSSFLQQKPPMPPKRGHSSSVWLAALGEREEKGYQFNRYLEVRKEGHLLQGSRKQHTHT